MTNHIDPDRAQFDAFKALDRETPLNMLNLVRFKDLANYPGDHELAPDGLFAEGLKGEVKRVGDQITIGGLEGRGVVFVGL